MGFVDKKTNIEYHQTYPFRALSDWNMTWYVCVFAVCSSAVCWSGKLQRSQRPPRPRSLSGTQWVINHRGSSIFSEKEILLFVWSKVNSSPDTYFFYLFIFGTYQVKSWQFYLYCPKLQIKKWASVSVQHKTPHMLRFFVWIQRRKNSIFNAFQELFCCFKLFSVPCFP